MKQPKNTCLLSLVLLLLTADYSMAQSVKTRPVNLFNGKNLDGWYRFVQKRGRENDVKKVFTVKNGLIHISGEEYGSIITNKEYENYKLVVEFKWGEKTYAPRVDRARDNGVLLHSTGEDGGYNGIWMHSIECQIIEGGTGDFLVVGDGSDRFALTSNVAPKKEKGGNVFSPTGTPLTIHSGRIDWFDRDPDWKDVLGFRGAKDVEKPFGEWNIMECVAEGDKISTFVNGVLVNQAYNVKPSKGRIQIQSEGAEMFVKRVELTPLVLK
ncbi:hypothetical protein DYBT9275_05942 [Dyadobacter sp. CECT 9275]|uniref:3-keto-alpha-glucoside-1,2-lyase/3-keto-2-hydroxy-glucal hydratase domain-containing protein n=1 Tax=Dyadobacter helix TaxID=2822344 RepID=A0A916JJ41_9BACT|nr:DUF1080 domain-containing protein [Dyadobacter sp. CECT 9275]CAG5018154.1 hypothetical protein DYBT9275_05942 [Dyadobacter sp. CECT 9275]